MSENGNNRLTGKMRRFVTFYLEHWNGIKAAKLAGYQGDYTTLGVTAHRLLKNAKIRVEIEKRLATEAMGANEVLWRLGQQARSEHAAYVNPDGSVDLPRLIADGRAHLIKSIYETKHGTRVEFYDGQAALVHIGRHFGLFKDRIEHSWREQARQDGIDPDELFDSLVNEFTTAMVGESGARSVASSETENDSGASG